MLEEKAGYLNESPINIKITHIENYPLHYHNDPEFIYVLKGFITLKSGSSIYKMKQGDIFVVNESEVHGIYSCSQNNVVMMLQIDTRYFAKYFPTLSNSVFRTLGKDRDSERIVNLRNWLLQIAFNHLKNVSGNKLENVNIMNDILRYLYKYFAAFCFEGKTVIQKNCEKSIVNERLSRIIGYIYQYHYRNITLKDLAEMEYLSEYYISHIISEGTGLNFREFLAFARVESSEKILLQTNKRISTIAKEVGFSTTAYYERFFEKWYMCRPDEYRKTYADHIKGMAAERVVELETEDALEIVSELIDFLSFSKEEGFGKLTNREIAIDCNAKSEKQFTKKIKLGGSATADGISSNDWNLIQSFAWDDSEGNYELHDSVDLNYIWDTVATVPYLLGRYLDDETETLFENDLYDSTNGTQLIKGQRGLFSSHKIKKPSFYAYRIFTAMKGDIIAEGKGYLVTESKADGTASISILFYNTSDQISELFEFPKSMNEIERIISLFNDSRTYRVTFEGLKKGFYDVVKIKQEHKKSLFSIAYMDNGSRKFNYTPEEIITLSESTIPETVFESTYIEDGYHMDINLKGLSYCYVRLICRL